MGSEIWDYKNQPLRGFSTFGGEDLYDSMFEKAAALGESPD